MVACTRFSAARFNFAIRGSEMHPVRLKRHQRGISLFVVMVMVMLSMLLVMGSGRLALLNESMTGNDIDYQRALEAAQTMLADAEMDLLGISPTGTACTGASCRTPASPVFFPRDMLEYQDLEAQLIAAAGTNNPPCLNGICLDLGAQTNGDRTTSFWNDPGGTDPNWNNTRTLATFIATPTGFNSRGALYGQYTGVTYSATNNSNNPQLNPATPNAWYWIEVLPYNPNAAVQGGNAAFWSPPATLPLVYRITAVARGRKPGVVAAVQSYLVPDPLRATP